MSKNILSTMNFSKTTWFVLLFIVAFLVAGVCVYQWWQTKGELEKQTEQNENLIRQIEALQKKIEDKKAEVTIATNKKEYKQGELIKITIRNGLDNSISYLDAERGGRNPWWGLQKFEGGQWTERKVHKPIDGECLIIVSEQVPIEELVKELKSNSERSDNWSLENCEEISPIGPKLEPKLMKQGTYRVFFKYGYGLTKNSYNAEIIYSDEFTIK